MFTYLLTTFEEKGEPKLIRTELPLLTSLTPYRWAKPAHKMYDDDDVELHVLGCCVELLGTNCDQCRSTVQCCFTSPETVRLIRTGAQDGHLDFHTA